MSIRLMTQVWDSNLYSSGALLVLLAMADYADDDDHTCHPSIGALAKKARLTSRQVQRILKQMKGDGVISAVGERPTRSGSPIVVYQIQAKALAKGDNLPPLRDTRRVTSTTQKGDIHDALRVTPVSYDPSLDPPIDPSEGQQRAAALPPAPPVTPPAPAPTSKTPTATQSVAFALEGEPLPPSRAQTPLSLSKLPAVVAYRDIFLAYPPKSQMVQMQAHGIEDVERWRMVLGAWCRCGYSPRNIGGMLDWYDDPTRMATPGAKGAKPGTGRAPAQSKVAASLQAVDDVFAMLDRAGGMD